MAEKLKLALYWAATCGGCEIAVLDLNEKILDLAAAADIYFWPVAMDFKYKDAESWPDQFIDVCLFNGAIRNSEGEHMAHLLRQKSKVLVAFGSCACFGGIPGLANVADRAQVFSRVYKETWSTDNPDEARPQTTVTVPEGELTLPSFYDTVYSLDQVEDVDYFLPGCPPVPDRIWEVIGVILSGQLPPKGSTVGVTDTTVCEECPRNKEEKMVDGFVRPHLVQADKERCLLEQGIVCLGPATRGGCGARCVQAWMPCRGCYGPTDQVTDQGAKMLCALSSIINASDDASVRKTLDGILDPLGTLYRFTLPTSLLHRVAVGNQGSGDHESGNQGIRNQG
jgi:F420-non-reducing hydrogenase small subunit